MWHMIKKRPDVRCFWQKNDRPGVMKDKDTADEFQYIINVKLRNNSCRFSSEFFTTSRKHTVESMKGHFRQELETYHYEYKEPKNDKGKPSYRVTGKGSESNDDVMVAYGMNVFWPKIILRDMNRVKTV